MIRKAALIFCANEHGSGDVCFPDIYGLENHEITQLFIEPKTARQLRREAKLLGWGVVDGADYCPGCMEGGI